MATKPIEWTMPSSPKDQESIHNCLVEIENAMLQIKAQNDHIKTICARLKDEHEMPAGFAKQLARTSLEADIAAKEANSETFEIAYKTLVEFKKTRG